MTSPVIQLPAFGTATCPESRVVDVLFAHQAANRMSGAALICLLTQDSGAGISHSIGTD